MRIALVPLRTKIKNINENLKRFRKILSDLTKEQKPDLVILPECSFTGYLYEKNDLNEFAEPLEGFIYLQIKELVQQYNLFIIYGFVEKNSNGIFNTGVLMDKEGKLLLIYRKISEKPPYNAGKEFVSITTQFGKIGMLICGDLFFDKIISVIPDDLDFLIVPMARGFDKKSPDEARWKSEEKSIYLNAIKKIGVTSVIVNALDEDIKEGSFGGAMVIDANGNLLAESSHGTDSVLVYDF